LRLVAGGWFVLREKYCWLVADKPSEQMSDAARLRVLPPAPLRRSSIVSNSVLQIFGSKKERDDDLYMGYHVKIVFQRPKDKRVVT
jgi:hypothetical protein